MSSATVQLTPQLRNYLLDVGIDELEPLRRLREETALLPDARMQISPEQGAFMAWLARTLGVRTALDVGVYTGYSGLCVATAMGPAGRLTALDVSEDFTRIARKHWTAAGVAERIDLRIAAAIDTLDALLRDGRANSYDQAFIDADKENYVVYFDRCLQLVRPGGVILFDNVLWSGRVIDSSQTDADTVAIRELNQRLASDNRIERVMLPLGDGLTLCRKK
jgi:predicted O-methyltransferase YrrM